MAAAADKKKLTLRDLQVKKQKGEQITWITSYTHPQARFAEKAGVDMILVGDSGGMCVLGYENTIPVTMEEMMHFSKAVRRGAPNTFIIGDMPFNSYQISTQDAVSNAIRFLKEAGCDAIKLEGGVSVMPQIKAIAEAGIVVFAHCGMTPQSSGAMGGYLAQGRTGPTARKVIEDSYAVQEAGAHCLLLEAIPPEVGGYLTKQLDIPVYGIGAGPDCDGQLLIISDVIGEFQAFTPKFVKKYGNVAEVTTKAIADYCDDVRNKKFPEDPAHCYHVLSAQKENVEKVFKEMARK